MFRILVVDDDPSAVPLLQEVKKSLPPRYELYFAEDGVEALDFLHGRGQHTGAPRPDLILLDLNMPRLNGLETLSAIKTDPELCVIPVFMHSTESSPQKVRKCYQAHANCYLQKPTDLDRTLKLAQAFEAFWTEFVVFPGRGGRTPEGYRTTDYKGGMASLGLPEPGKANSGTRIATESVKELSSRTDDSPTKAEIARPSRRSSCEEHNRLLEKFGVAVQAVLKLHEEQFQAIIQGDTDSYRFDLLIHMASEKKQMEKYGYLRHVEAHGCSNTKCP